ncbi:MAG: histidinol phosphate phosphatase domain-containing protein [Nitrospiraceae bacterium]|nr:MAG: histidinol phosphate phosphatase domain-containing protein [Nitrospiraceae bacterium]
MIDLHTHTLFSDGVLLPSELVQRAYHAGYKAIALTDHMDMSNVDFIVPRLVKAAAELSGYSPLTIIPGAEITHVPPDLIGKLVADARDLGAGIVVVHGETIAEPVIPGTNRAGIESGADILSHPGLISIEDAALAAEKGVALEITARKGHSLSNGHVAKVAMMTGASMVINTDSHGPEDLISRTRAAIILRAAGVPEESIETIFSNSRKLVERVGRS